MNVNHYSIIKCMCVYVCTYSLLQSADEGVAEEVKKALKGIIPKLKDIQNSKGVEALLEKLA